MRGTLNVLGASLFFAGIIPAYAGNTRNLQYRACHHRDHPRVCGEHAGDLTPEQVKAGSSPRMRGTRG